MGASTSSARLVRQERLDQPRYRLVSRIATGGMAEVFLAVMPGSCGSTKPLVIKRLWPQLAQDPEHLQLFLDEVRLTLSLHHPNVIHGYESGSDGAFPYLAIEYLDGQSFKHILDRLRGEGGLGLPLAFKIICDVLAGLEYVHSLTDLSGRPLRVVHCDVSPQNVFVTCDGAVKLIDFGIAKSVMAQSPALPRETRGRVAYMAPEQLVGDTVDHRADLFSVGVMLWEAAVGQRLWHGLTDGEIMQRLLSPEAPPRLPRGQGFPPGLAAICARALALDPNQRYSSASEFQSDLAAVSTGSMPAQTRLLGGLVTRVFASSRALSRTMIQQSLADDDAPTALVARSAQPAARQEIADRAPTDGTTEKRPSGALLVAMQDEVTQAGPFPSRPGRSMGWLPLVGVAVALVAAGFAYLRLGSVRVGASALAYGTQNVHVAQTRLPQLGAATVVPREQPPTPGDADLTELTKPAPETDRSPKSWRSRPWAKQGHFTKRPATVAIGEILLTKERDVFDLPLPRPSGTRAGRPIDREDPYGP